MTTKSNAKRRKAGHPQKISPETDLQAMVDEYFNYCHSTREERELKNGDIRVRQVLPSMVGLAYYLGIDDNTLYSYLNGNYSKDPDLKEVTDKFKVILARAKQRMELELLEAASNGDVNDRVAMARLAKFGYGEKHNLESKNDIKITWPGISDDDFITYSK